MDEAKQSFCVLAGGKEYIRDSILAGMLAKNQIFPSLNLLVVPIEMEVAEDGRGPKGLAKGFGNNSLSYEQEGYVAAPVNVSVHGLVCCPCSGALWALLLFSCISRHLSLPGPTRPTALFAVKPCSHWFTSRSFAFFTIVVRSKMDGVRS